MWFPWLETFKEGAPSWAGIYVYEFCPLKNFVTGGPLRKRTVSKSSLESLIFD